MIAQAYRDEYAYWTNEEYLPDLKNADLEVLKAIYSKWKTEVSGFTGRGIHKSERYVFYEDRIRLLRNPLVRIYNKSIELGLDKEIRDEMLIRIDNMDGELIKNLSPYQKRKRR